MLGFTVKSTDKISNDFKIETKNINLSNLVNNGGNYENWTMAGSGSTKSSEGIHLVESTNTEKAYTTNVIEAILPNRTYKLTITVKDST